MSGGDVYNLAKVFLSFSPKQRKDFLTNIKQNQCNLIRSASYNILLNTDIVLTENQIKYLKPRASRVKRLASKRVCLQDKKSILLKNVSLIKKILSIVVEYIDIQRSKKKEEEK